MMSLFRAQRGGSCDGGLVWSGCAGRRANMGQGSFLEASARVRLQPICRAADWMEVGWRVGLECM